MLACAFVGMTFTSGCSADFAPLSWVRDRLSGPEAGTGGPAADFAFDTFSGQRVELAELKGRPVVLSFWASWCIPCRAEMPYFEKIYREYRDQGVVFVGLAVQDDPQSAQDFLVSLGVTYPTGPDRRNEVSTSYSLVGLPTTIFITPEATVAKRWNGPVSEDQLTALIKEMVARPGGLPGVSQGSGDAIPS